MVFTPINSLHPVLTTDVWGPGSVISPLSRWRDRSAEVRGIAQAYVTGQWPPVSEPEPLLLITVLHGARFFLDGLATQLPIQNKKLSPAPSPGQDTFTGDFC